MAFLKSILQRINPARPREAVELNPVAQIAVRYIAQYGSKSAAEIEREVTAHRTLIDDELDDALSHLLATGLAETTLRLTSGQAETFYAPTKKARRLRNTIPADPRTVMEFYL